MIKVRKASPVKRVLLESRDRRESPELMESPENREKTECAIVHENFLCVTAILMSSSDILKLLK